MNTLLYYNSPIYINPDNKGEEAESAAYSLERFDRLVKEKLMDRRNKGTGVRVPFSTRVADFSKLKRAKGRLFKILDVC